MSCFYCESGTPCVLREGKHGQLGWEEAVEAFRKLAAESTTELPIPRGGRITHMVGNIQLKDGSKGSLRGIMNKGRDFLYVKTDTCTENLMAIAKDYDDGGWKDGVYGGDYWQAEVGY
ncbi:MAG: hypothetical protein M1833_000212 [Piccolia ochrophora]|nr:MAG: hypothetical protein M1833_000212 [Piccolia ochrophora]